MNDGGLELEVDKEAEEELLSESSGSGEETEQSQVTSENELDDIDESELEQVLEEKTKNLDEAQAELN